jgi:hypothetical protein
MGWGHVWAMMGMVGRAARALCRIGPGVIDGNLGFGVCRYFLRNKAEQWSFAGSSLMLE